MSDTPRTDALEYRNKEKDVYSSFFEMRSHAWQLERELTDAKAMLVKNKGAVTISRNGYVEELESEFAKAKKQIKELTDAVIKYSGGSSMLHPRLARAISTARKHIESQTND